MSWGYHLMLDCAKCVPYTIRSKSNIIAFSNQVVRDIDMVPFGPPQVQHFGSGNKAGYTLVQLIETSNITAHFCEETNDMYLDVFSCKPFSPKTVHGLVSMYFGPLHVTRNFITRQAMAQNENILPKPEELK
jgi:S-adenosylmethionine/arginine decarboxylase-like enzyme